jgi:hypothetical protein
MQSFLRKSTITYLLVAALGGIFGAFLISYCQDGSCMVGTPAYANQVAVSGFDPTLNQKMLGLSTYYVWFIFMACTTSLAFLLAAPLWNSLRQFKSYLTRGKMRDLAFSTIVLLLLFLVPDGIIGSLVGGRKSLPIYLFFPRVAFLEAVIFCICLVPAFYSIWLIRDAIETEFDRLRGNENDPLNFIKIHMQYREYAQNNLLAIGLLITLATLATAANRMVGIALDLDPNRVTTLLVLTYGLYFTVLVAITYVPTYLALLHTGSELRDKLFPILQIDKLGETMAKRKAFEDHLQLNIDLEQSLRTGLVILSPLLSGILSTLITKN